MIFSPSPAMSYLSAEWVAQDPKYWGKMAVMAAKPAASAPATGQPPAAKP